jgi:hypothetical protein
MKKLIAVYTISDYMNNEKFLKVYSNGEEITYSLIDQDRRLFSISNLQTKLPMFEFDFESILDVIHEVRLAIKRSVYYEKNLKCLV